MEEEKQIKNSQEQCPSCGGRLRYSPEDGALKCEFCDKKVEIEYVKNREKHDFSIDAKHQKQHDDYASQTKVFKCSSCGSNIVLNALEVSSICPYCNSPCVIDESIDIGLKPDYIIPFKFSIDQVKDLYKKGMKKKWFIPNKFKKSPPMDHIKGIYIPTFAFDAHTESDYQGVLEEDYTTTDSEGRSHTHTRSFSISGHVSLNHTDVMVETSTHIDQSSFDALKPFNTSGAVEYKPQFILGYSVEHYDNSLENCKRIADSMMEDYIRQTALSRYSYDRVRTYNQDTNFSEQKYAYYIVPTYRFNYKYKEKDYTTFMNGQTGKVGKGVPRSAVKITFFVLFWLLVIGGIIALVMLSE